MNRSSKNMHSMCVWQILTSFSVKFVSEKLSYKVFLLESSLTEMLFAFRYSWKFDNICTFSDFKWNRNSRRATTEDSSQIAVVSLRYKSETRLDDADIYYNCTLVVRVCNSETISHCETPQRFVVPSAYICPSDNTTRKSFKRFINEKFPSGYNNQNLQ